MTDKRILASRTFPAPEHLDMSATEKRAACAALVAELTQRGYVPREYQLECLHHPDTDSVTLRAHEVDVLDQPLAFDDRGVV